MPETVTTRNPIKAVITGSAIIVVDTVNHNDYGDLTFIDKESNSYKIAVKRIKFFESIITPGAAVKLNYAEAYGKPYIYSAVKVEGALPPPVKPQEPLPEHQEVIKEAVKSTATAVKEVSGQEQGMWWKEMGECFRTGLFKKDEGVGKTLWIRYCSQMLDKLGISIETKGK